MLQDGRDERDAASCGDGCRTIAAKRGSGRKLAAHGDNIAQRLVEIAHLFGLHALLPPTAHSLCDTKYTGSESECKGRTGRPPADEPPSPQGGGWNRASNFARSCSLND